MMVQYNHKKPDKELPAVDKEKVIYKRKDNWKGAAWLSLAAAHKSNMAERLKITGFPKTETGDRNTAHSKCLQPQYKYTKTSQ